MMSMEPQNWSKVRRAMREAVRRYIYDPNVAYIDFGWRERGGVLLEDEPPRIRVHVEKKFRGAALEAAQDRGVTRAEIQGPILGYEVDIPQAVFRTGWWSGTGGWRQPVNPRAGRFRPMRGGISVSNAYRNIYGTLGGLVTDRETRKPMLLSNFHVLVPGWYTREGQPIYQPARGDGGRAVDTVAQLSRHAMDSNLDAAVAQLTPGSQLINDQLGLAPVTGVAWAQVGMNVVKSGRTTDVTHGRVTGVEGTARLYYSGVYRLIRNVIKIEPRLDPDVSEGGDSGSFWLDEETMKVVGLHFARGKKRHVDGLAIDIQPILDVLNINMGT